LFPKPVTYRNEDYLGYVRGLPCARCGRSGAVAAHQRCLGGGGMGLKPSDYHAVPLCWECHGEEHRGAKTFWEGVDLKMLVIGYLSEYVEGMK
jgi:hypothetical protein